MPLFRELAKVLDLEVFFCHRVTAAEQGTAGFGVAFDWDVDLLSGYNHHFLKNEATRPGVNHFAGCDTPEIRTILRKGNFDGFVVSGWYLRSFWQAIRACRKHGVPVIVRGDSQMLTPRSPFKRWAKNLLYPLLLRQFDAFLAVGKRNWEYLTHFGVPDSKIYFAPHFVDNEWFLKRADEARPRREKMRAMWGADEQTLVILFVGKFRPIKRPQDILHALPRLNKDGVSNVAVFVGSGEMNEELNALAKSLGVKAKFEGFKNQSELPVYYVAADVLVLPSESETWGLVVNEAMACGLPAIVSDTVGCGADLIEEGRTGYIYPVGNADMLAKRLSQFAIKRRAGVNFGDRLSQVVAKYSVEASRQGVVTCLEAIAGDKNR